LSVDLHLHYGDQVYSPPLPPMSVTINFAVAI